MPENIQPVRYPFLPFLVRFVFRLIMFTVRVKVLREDGGAFSPEKPWPVGRMYAVWHQHLFPAAFLLRHQAVTAIVSLSRDGEYLARILGAWGFGLIRGSSSRGGPEVSARSVEHLKGKGKLWITPDGPRGPSHVVKWGVVRMALASESIVLPIGIGYSRKIALKSWDKFQIPLPFSRAVIICGNPYSAKDSIGDEADVKRLSIELETRLNEVTDRAERLASA
jgi:lysophospholipid acyltransferase (LPLAT)-like uncharacterized protein